MDAIYRRRSIRKYKPEKILLSLVEEIIKAGMNAPSAGNEQPWHFIVLDDRSILDRIPEVHPHSKMIREAPAAILICGDIDLEMHEGFWVQDCSAATQNILLAATQLGLGSVWLGVYPREDRIEGLRDLLNIPVNIIPFALIPLGYPDQEPKPPKRREQAEYVHLEKF